MSRVIDRLYPERRVSNFAHCESRIVFFSLVNELVQADHVVVDYGAGRGRIAEMGGRHLHMISNYRGRCRTLIGADVDQSVLENKTVDETMLILADGRIPLPDNSVDVIYSYAVFEHIDEPEIVARELSRILKPNGWICAWTPNKWGYVGLGARMVPNKLHVKALKFISPGGRDAEDIFPVVYKMNTRTDIGKLFPDLEDFSFYFNGTPSYNFGSVIIARMWLIYMAITPRFLSKSLMVFLQKPSA